MKAEKFLARINGLFGVNILRKIKYEIYKRQGMAANQTEEETNVSRRNGGPKENSERK